MHFYIVLTETKDALGRIKFILINNLFENWTDADAEAKNVAKSSRRRAWVCEIPRPKLIDIVN